MEVGTGKNFESLGPLAQLLLRKFDVRKTATLGGLGTGLCIICVAFSKSVSALGIFFFLAGVCSSTICQASFVSLRHYFGDHFGTANSISYLGSLIGGMTVPFLTNQLHQAYGLQGTLLCLGGLFLNSVPIGAIFKLPDSQSPPTPDQCGLRNGQDVDEDEEDEDNGRSKNDSSDKTSFLLCCTNLLRHLSIAFDIKALRREPSFAIFFLPCQIILDIVFIGWALFMVSYAIDIGFSPSSAVYLPIAAASGGFISRSTLAIAMHYKPYWSPELYAMDVAISGLSLVLYPLYSNLSHLIICSFFAGYGLYGSASTYYAVIAVTVSEENFPGIIAISFFISGIGAILSGSLAGIIYDATKSFMVVFRIFGIMMGAIFILVILHICLHRYRKKHLHGTQHTN
ncbi:monocarboxylate transporter 2-like [Lytechinus variegatus]|uniref:monocarboxylate transporter 2-like n=1 Tax=Lytechinus variegatus TaxID=7654 RepID=UPI001BB15019|nr:monocarboxylate transporter 2-like [Lytechinus variegatus]